MGSVILLGGIVGSGKTELIESTKDILKQIGVSCESISVGDLLLDWAEKAGIETARINEEVSGTVEQALRVGLGYGVAYRAAGLESNVHLVVDTPFTLVNLHGNHIRAVYHYTFEPLIMHPANRKINRVVTVYEDPAEILRRINEKGYTAYPSDRNALLQWNSAEAAQGEDIADIYTPTRRRIVIPRKYSESTLAKLLLGDNPPVAYLAQPMTHVKNNQHVTEEIGRFRNRLQKYAVVINPIEGESAQNEDDQEVSHIVDRDLTYFVRESGYVIAFFPVPVSSSGVHTEMIYASQFGRKRILIYPKESQASSPFDQWADIKFQSADEFFDAVHTSPKSTKYRMLRPLLDNTGDNPRFGLLFD